MSRQKKPQLMFPFSKDNVMFIQHNLESVLVRHDVNIEKCAGLLKKNPVIIVVNSRNELLGTITNGDIRRLVEGGRFQTETVVTAGDACNSSPIHAHIEDSIETLTHLLTSVLGVLPLVDSNKIVQAFAYLGEPYFQIGDTRISKENNYIYTIAEIGVNHNGSIKIAKNLIKAAKAAGFSAVKLQIRSDEYFTTSDFNSLDLGAQYIKKEIRRTYIDFEGNAELIEYAKVLDIDMICTPFDHLSLDFCVKNNVNGLKIASCDLINTPLLKKAASTALPLIVSTGMSWEREIVHAYNQIVAHTSNFALLHCNSTYPAPENELNLKFPKYQKQIEMYYANHRNMIKGTFEESIKILNYLKINNYDCYVLSNWSAETFKGMIDDYPFLKNFDGLLISGEDKLIKPDLAIYQLAIKRFDLDPIKCVFIDDRLENIEAAKKLSFNVIHLTDPHSIEFSIKKYLN